MSIGIADLLNKKSKSNGAIVMFLAFILLMVLTIGGGIFLYNGQPGVRMQKALDAGEKYLSELDYEKAIASFNEALIIEPKEVTAYQGLVYIYAEQRKYSEILNQYSRAVEYVTEEKAEELKNDIIEYLWEGGMQAVVVGDYNTAIYCYEEIVKMNVSSTATQEILMEVKNDLCYVYLTLGEKERAEERYEEAISYYFKVVELGYKQVEVCGKICESYLIMATEKKEKGNFEDAIEYCNKALEINTDYVDALDFLCELYLCWSDNAKAGEDYDKAISCCKKVLDIIPEHGGALQRLCELYLILADIEREADKYDDAIMYCDKVLELEQENQEANKKLCEIYLFLAQEAEANNDYTKASQCYNWALDKEAENQVALDGKCRMKEREEVDVYKTILIEMMQAIAAGTYYDFSYTTILTGEFNDFIKKTLSQPVIYELENGLYLGVYPKGYIYYGEMENGVRSGKGYWCIGGIYQFNVCYTNWVSDAPNGEAVIELYTNESMIQKRGNNHFYCLYYKEVVNLVNGIYEGASEVKKIYDHDDLSIGFCNPHEYNLTYSNGARVPIEGKIAAYCNKCPEKTSFGAITTSNNVYKIEF